MVLPDRMQIRFTTVYRYGSGALFTSTYWSTFCPLLTVRRKLSTTFHLKIDGQTERQNQETEAYLRMYVNTEQSSWAWMLPEAAMAYNCKAHASTKMCLRELALGSSPTQLDDVPPAPPAPKVDGRSKPQRRPEMGRTTGQDDQRDHGTTRKPLRYRSRSTTTDGAKTNTSEYGIAFSYQAAISKRSARTRSWTPTNSAPS